MDEREQILRLKELRDAKTDLEAKLTDVKREYVRIESELVESLMADGKEATARYEDAGYCLLMQPKVRANVNKEFEDEFKSYLKSIGRDDIIKETIHPQTLCAFVKGALEDGQQLPDYVSYFLQPQMRLY
jgi:hypothetical protein